MRDSRTFDRAFAEYTRRVDEVVEAREVGKRAAEEDRERRARAEAEKVRNSRCEGRRVSYRAASTARPRRDALVSQARAQRRKLLARQRRRASEASEAVLASERKVAAAEAEAKRRRVEERVELALRARRFPKVTIGFAERHPEAAARIREMTSG
jgi:hypothetical protein